MTDSGSRRGAANLAPILMILSFAAMGGFLWWLSMTAEGTEPVVMEEEEDPAATMGATLVTPEQLREPTDSLLGQTVRLENAAVVTAVGSNAFLVEIGEEGQSQYLLVLMDSTLVSRGQSVPQGTTTVAGTLHERTDSVLDVWVEGGRIPESGRVSVNFTDHYIEAGSVRGGGAGPAGGGTGGGGAAEDGGGPESDGA